MGIKKALGGERLGSGNKMNVTLHGFNRSSHNIGQLFKTDQAIGTLVPYFCDIGLNGTTYDIDLTTKIRTLPTNGPIFGRLKHQIDVFHAPIRLYIRVLHNNALGIGMKMQNVKLPVMTLRANQPDMTKDDLNSQQISQDSLMAYLGVRGLGRSKTGAPSFTRTFPAMFLLMYWDTYKNYYANKQEEIGYVIEGNSPSWEEITLYDETGTEVETVTRNTNKNTKAWKIKAGYKLMIVGGDNLVGDIKDQVKQIELRKTSNTGLVYQKIIGTGFIWSYNGKNAEAVYNDLLGGGNWEVSISDQPLTKWTNEGINLKKFELSKIDEMREAILAAPKTAPFNIGSLNSLPYTASLANAAVDETNRMEMHHGSIKQDWASKRISPTDSITGYRLNGSTARAESQILQA